MVSPDPVLAQDEVVRLIVKVSIIPMRMYFKTGMAKVELACGDYRIVSVMSREAADELGLAPGVPAVAVMKATTVIIEQ